jgi:hypothetical protein
MDSNLVQQQLTNPNQFHPGVYRSMVALAVILILSVWGFSGNGHSGLVLSVVSLFVFVAVAIPVILWRIWRAHAVRTQAPGEAESFVAWQGRDIEIDGGHLKGSQVAFEALLPIAAVCLGMAVFALVLHFDIGA